MGPLLPFGIIGEEFSYIVALFIGFFFGFILEQAGFSTSKKLVGVFYGYDFVVLRVFFTAAATAVVGLLLMDYFGAIDISYLYINPTFMGPAIVGGVIMGLGFIVGGFCPGTSVVAAAVGKIDAMIFIFGSFIGIFIFGELYPAYGKFYYSGDLGSIFVYDSLGVSRGLFAAALVLIAIIAFIVTDRIEKRVKYGYPPIHPRYKMAIPAVIVGAGFAFIMLFVPGERQDLTSKELTEKTISKIEYISIDEAAYDILNRHGKFRFIDVRPDSEYKKFCLTGAINMTLEDISKMEYSSYFKNPIRIPVFYANDNEMARRAFAIAQDQGYSNCFVLEGGLNEFRNLIFKDNPIREASFIGSNTRDFRLRVRNYLNSDTSLTKPRVQKKVKMEIKKVQGGC
jgi:rhodanese-related sulfurtransferase